MSAQYLRESLLLSKYGMLRRAKQFNKSPGKTPVRSAAVPSKRLLCRVVDE